MWLCGERYAMHISWESTVYYKTLNDIKTWIYLAREIFYLKFSPFLFSHNWHCVSASLAVYRVFHAVRSGHVASSNRATRTNVNNNNNQQFDGEATAKQNGTYNLALLFQRPTSQCIGWACAMSMIYFDFAINKYVVPVISVETSLLIYLFSQENSPLSIS